MNLGRIPSTGTVCLNSGRNAAGGASWTDAEVGGRDNLTGRDSAEGPHPPQTTVSKKQDAAQDEVYRVLEDLNGSMRHFARVRIRNRQNSPGLSLPFRVPTATQVV